MLDASGVVVSLSAPPRRIVSLIPSITEILFALGVGEAVVGCTIFCTEPRDGVAGKTKVGGEKNPKLELIRELGADLVIANIEENVREHVEALRAWGIAVYVTYPRTVAAGIGLVAELGALTGARWLVVHRARLTAGERAAWDAAALPETARFGDDVVYELPVMDLDWRPAYLTQPRDATFAGTRLAPLPAGSRADLRLEGGFAVVKREAFRLETMVTNAGDVAWPDAIRKSV